MSIFTANDRTPFTYVVTHVATEHRYYGAKYSEGCQPSDLWCTYFTSSRVICGLVKAEGREAFQTEVRKTFASVEACLNWELSVLRRLKVDTNDRWYNKSAGGKRFYSVLVREQNSNFGKHWHTPQGTRDKIAASLSGKKKSDSHRHNIAVALEGSSNPMFGKNVTDDTRRKIAEAGRRRTQPQTTRNKIAEAQMGGKNHRYGKSLSPEERLRLRDTTKGTVWVNNPNLRQRKRIKPHEFPTYRDGGWVRGRAGRTSVFKST